ncbi:MAG: type II secretion system F family protein [Vulcanimicrobiota bacterium]
MKKRTMSLPERIGHLMPIPVQEFAVFYNQMAFLYKAGIPMTRAIGILSEQTANIRMRDILKDLRHQVETGHTLTDGMLHHREAFSVLYTTLINTGEVSGTLEIMLNRAALLKEKEMHLSQKIRQAATYPTVIFSFMLLFILVMGKVLIVNLAPLLKSGEVKLPFITHLFLGLYGVLSNPGLLLLIAIAIAVLCWRYRKALAIEQVRVHQEQFLFSIPILGGLLKTITFSRFCNTLSTLTESGVSLRSGIILAGEASGSSLCLRYCHKLQQTITEGGFLYEGFREFLFFSPMIRDMVRVGEESGSLPYLLAQASHLMDIQVEHSLVSFTSALEPLLMACLGVVVALLAFSVLLPLNGLVSAIG